MKTVGITAEYNPFHNGHVYHIRKAGELAGADCVVAVMSGDFTQRGEPAVCDKWERAKAAVTAPGGADLVVELPFAFACNKASIFAKGAVDMLVRLGVDCISFGCEAEDPQKLRETAAGLLLEKERIEEVRTSLMKTGISNAKAYELAVRQITGDEAAELLQEPNNILAAEYLKRIAYWRDRGYQVEDLPIKRHGSGYSDVAAEGEDYAGAGALRQMLRRGEDVRRYVPEVPEFADGAQLAENYLKLLKSAVLRSSPEELSHIYGIGEGLENSIIREARKADQLESLIAGLTSRRYTGATIMRALTHVLMGTEWEEIDQLTAQIPSAGRILAASDAGRRFIRGFSSEDFTMITNINKEAELIGPRAGKLLELDEKAADLYNLLLGKNLYKASDRVRHPYMEDAK